MGENQSDWRNEINAEVEAATGIAAPRDADGNVVLTAEYLRRLDEYERITIIVHYRHCAAPGCCDIGDIPHGGKFLCSCHAFEVVNAERVANGLPPFTHSQAQRQIEAIDRLAGTGWEGDLDAMREWRTFPDGE